MGWNESDDKGNEGKEGKHVVVQGDMVIFFFSGGEATPSWVLSGFLLQTGTTEALMVRAWDSGWCLLTLVDGDNVV